MAESGDAEAQFQVARSYYIGDGVEEDEEEAVVWYRKAARKGHAEAMYRLGVCYYLGAGVAENGARAMEWFKKSAAAGFKKAQKTLEDIKKGRVIPWNLNC